MTSEHWIFLMNTFLSDFDYTWLWCIVSARLLKMLSYWLGLVVWVFVTWLTQNILNRFARKFKLWFCPVYKGLSFVGNLYLFSAIFLIVSLPVWYDFKQIKNKIKGYFASPKISNESKCRNASRPSIFYLAFQCTLCEYKAGKV